MSEENIGGEEGIIEERRKKLQILRDKNKAYVNDFLKDHYAKSLHEENDSFSKSFPVFSLEPFITSSENDCS